MKKIIALLLVLALAVSCFVGCNNNTPADTKDTTPVDTKDNTPDDTTAATESNDPYDGTHDVIELTWLIRQDPQDGDEKVWAELNKILEERYNLHVNFISIPGGEYNDRTTLMMTGGETWDLCYTASWTNNYWERVNMGAFYDLNELMDSPVWAELMEVYPEGWYDNAVVDGHLYGLPNYQIEYSPQAVYVQKDLADKYGLPYKTGDFILNLWDEEFYAWMEKVRDNEKDVWVLRDKNGVGKQTSPSRTCYNRVASMEFNDPDYEVYFDMDEEHKAALVADYWQRAQLYLDGFYRPDFATVTDDSTDFKSNRYACYVNTGKPGGDVSVSATQGEEYIMIYLGDGTWTRSPDGGMTTVTAINYASKNPEAALKLLTVFWTDVEVYNMFVYGIEGEHYVKVNDGKQVKLITDSDYSKQGFAWGVANSFNRIPLSTEDLDVHAQTEAMNAASIRTNLSGFRWSNTDVTTEVGQINTVYSEYANQFKTCKSEAEVEAWYDAYAEALLNAGAMAVVEELDEQITAWRAANGK